MVSYDEGSGDNKFIVQSSTDSQQEKKAVEQKEPKLIIQRYDDIDEYEKDLNDLMNQVYADSDDDKEKDKRQQPVHMKRLSILQIQQSDRERSIGKDDMSIL